VIQIHDPDAGAPADIPARVRAVSTPPGTVSGDDPTISGSSGNLPAESLEQGAAASTYVDNPDKPHPTTVAALEVLPDESKDGDESDD